MVGKNQGELAHSLGTTGRDQGTTGQPPSPRLPWGPNRWAANPTKIIKKKREAH